MVGGSWLFTSVAMDMNSELPLNKSRYWSDQNSNLGPLDYKSDTLTNLLHCLHL